MKYAKTRMLDLKMSKCEMYVALLSILAGPAKTLVMKSDHNDGDFNLAMEKLTKEYLNRNSFVNELSMQLDFIQPMPDKNVAKMTKFFQEVTAITEQLKEVSNDDTSVCYQLQTTLYHKLNHKAQDKWCDLTLKNKIQPQDSGTI